MVAERVQRPSADNTSLSTLLAANGASLDRRQGLSFTPGRNAKNMKAILRGLLVESRDSTMQLHGALAALWVELGTGKYGSRTEMLRECVPSQAVQTVQRRLMNYAAVYRRWQHVGFIPGKSWTFHAEHTPGETAGKHKRCIIRAEDRQRVIDAALRFLNTGEVRDLEKLREAAAPLMSPSDTEDDTDDFEVTE